MTLSVSSIGLIAASCCAAALADEQTPLDNTWSLWRKGNIEQAEQQARGRKGTDESRHLLACCAIVKGRYAKAVKLYRGISPSYKKRKELDRAIVQALLHLHRYDEAAKLAKDCKVVQNVQSAVAARARRPLKVSLNKLTAIPFADHPLTPYFPAFPAKINGKTSTVHLDTGGTWLIMGPERAKKLGIKLVADGEGFHGRKKVKLQRGTAESFTLGGAVLKNVPVVGMPTLTGLQDFVIFGTNVLQQFHSTLDYPGAKLLLCPRGNNSLIKKQMSAHKTKRVEVPFFMWGDHYMFVRGGFGRHGSLNFFVDSGLVALNSSGGKIRQACFTATPANYRKWGIDKSNASARFFESKLPLSLGPLVQRNQYFTTTPKTIAGNLGGVRIDGLISHAFLKAYVWTLDFDRMRYVFSKPGR